MPTRSRRPPRRQTPDASRVSKRIALNERIEALHAEITNLRRARAAVSRNEFREVVNSLREIQRNTDDIIEHAKRLTTQVTRMAQMQAQIDVIHHYAKCMNRRPTLPTSVTLSRSAKRVGVGWSAASTACMILWTPRTLYDCRRVPRRVVGGHRKSGHRATSARRWNDGGHRRWSRTNFGVNVLPRRSSSTYAGNPTEAPPR